MLFKPKTADLNDAEKIAWLRLIRTDGIGAITFRRLIETFGSAGKAIEALPEMGKRGGGKKSYKPASAAEAEKELSILRKNGGDIICMNDLLYPPLLAACEDAPPVLSYLGNPELMTRPCIAIVGARNASLNGRKFVEKLAKDLGDRGQIIVSGLARGVDTAAHNGSLSTGTIAVVAGGIDVVYPEENMALYQSIREKGLVLAESPLGQKPFAQSFPRRNRIVSGLSRAVIVGEANMRSGSLITARLAGEQGRELMAIPGSPLDPRSAGPNHLIREGAMLITSADDVLETLLDFSGNAMREPINNNDEFVFDAIEELPDMPDEELQNFILEQLSHTPTPLDELVRSCHVNMSSLQLALLELELAGRIKRSAGGGISLVE